MERRFRRNYVCFPVDLVFGEGASGLQAPASVIDISQGGLRVQTGPRLIPGGVLHVLLEGRRDPFARCRVVWSNTHGGALPSEARLEILDSAAGGSGHGVKMFSPLAGITGAN